MPLLVENKTSGLKENNRSIKLFFFFLLSLTSLTSKDDFSKMKNVSLFSLVLDPIFFDT